MNPNECQLHRLPDASEGTIKVAPPSLSRRLELALSRRLSPAAKRKLKTYFIRLATPFARPAGGQQSVPAPAAASSFNVKAGDRVRVRSKAEIQATLTWNELKGCGFMPEMEEYCGTTRRVLKPVTRFLDERDYKVKKCNGIVLLEDAICRGTALFGPCDRSCFFFWREEWLEKVGPD